MSGYPIELNFRLEENFQAAEWNRVAALVIQAMGFDEDTSYDLVIEKTNGERLDFDLRRKELPARLNPAIWPALHQVFLSNHWMKDLNMKIHLVTRQDHSVLDIKLDLADPKEREKISEQIREQLRAWQTVDKVATPSLQERERLFGSMLLAEQVAQKTKRLFLAGDFAGSLNAALGVLREQFLKVFHLAETAEKKISTLLLQDPPSLLFPDLSGEPLRQTLEGLQRLWEGTVLWLNPILKGKTKPPEDPARVLKYLVLISLLCERMENAVLNPVGRLHPFTKAPQLAAGMKKGGIEGSSPLDSEDKGCDIRMPRGKPRGVSPSRRKSPATFRRPKKSSRSSPARPKTKIRKPRA